MGEGIQEARDNRGPAIELNRSGPLPFLGIVAGRHDSDFVGALAAFPEALLRCGGWASGQPYGASTVSGVVGGTSHAAGVALPPQLFRTGGSMAALNAWADGALGREPGSGAIALEVGGATGWFHTERVESVSAV